MYRTLLVRLLIFFDFELLDTFDKMFDARVGVKLLTNKLSSEVEKVGGQIGEVEKLIMLDGGGGQSRYLLTNKCLKFLLPSYLGIEYNLSHFEVINFLLYLRIEHNFPTNNGQTMVPIHSLNKPFLSYKLMYDCE